MTAASKVRLSLSIDAPPSSSPFPSPSSSFLPPPMPGAHEFAVKPAPQPRSTNRFLKSDLDHISSNLLSTDIPDHNHIIPTLGLPDGAPSPLPAFSPSTPTPTSNSAPSFIHNWSPDRHPAPLHIPSSTSPTAAASITLPSPFEPGPMPLQDSPQTPRRSLSLSLLPPGDPTAAAVSPGPTSTRRAPPSPDLSRHTHLSGSTGSSTSSGTARPRAPAVTPKSSRPPSAALSRANSSRSLSRANSSRSKQQRHSVQNPVTAPSPASPSVPALAAAVLTAAGGTVTSPRPPPFFVRIRDFAYPPHDERHQGLGADVPKPNRPRVLNHFRNDSSASAASGDGEEEDDGWGFGAAAGAGGRGAGAGEWGGFSWGMGRFSWGVGRFVTGSGAGAGAGAGGGGGYVPSTTDFARNFAEPSSPTPQTDEYDEEEEEEEAPLYPGLYRALYAFESEGTAEMALEEDQLVQVVGRGGGVGWAVVVRERGVRRYAGGPEAEGDQGQDGAGDDDGLGKHALVPESYLEVVKLDEEDNEDVAEWW